MNLGLRFGTMEKRKKSGENSRAVPVPKAVFKHTIYYPVLGLKPHLVFRQPIQTTVVAGDFYFSDQMFGSSSTLFIFNVPLSLLHHRPSTLLRPSHRHSLTCPLHLLSAVAHRHLLLTSRANSNFPIKSSQQIHSQSTGNTLQDGNDVPADAYLVPPSHPWPELSDLLEYVSNLGYLELSRNMKDEFVPNESLPMEFVDAACSCLGFAHDRSDILGWLSKDDIQVLIDGGAPFLFKNALETERRMRSFLQGEESNDVTTVDLMKYILSYASNPIIYPERNIREATESSARNLLREMANFSCKGAALSLPDIEKFNGAIRAGDDEQTPRNLEPSNKMKRGDWICPECSFMNSAKNTECVECMELRPRRQLTGCEWDCPRCNFYNHGRNMACLKCECGRPGEVPLPVGQSINSQNQNNFSNNRTANGNDNLPGTNKNLEASFIGNLDQFHSNASSGQDAGKDGRFPIPKGRNSGYAPFVPLPADMFAEKSENVKPKTTGFVSNSENSATKVGSGSKDTSEDENSDRGFEKVFKGIRDDDFPEIMPMRKGENRFVVSKKKDRSLTSPKHQRQQAMEQESNSKFVPFVPFPPDYFAKKDDKQQSKGTTKPTDDMNLVQETRNQETSSKDFLNSRSSVDNGGASSGNQAVNSSSTQMSGNETVPETSYGGRKTPEIQTVRNGGESSSNQTANSSSTQMNGSETVPETSYGGRKTPEIQKVRNGGESSSNKTENSLSTRMNGNETVPETSYVGRKTSEPEKVRNGWKGKSLEGSAVKETDPLDMSEEAKAERWFRRVAQIKDISELSQIPDEDFPSIMPMRKGVNRFVVSKRKTPLERRLTSPKYRKNLRTVSSDPTKKEGDDN
ncbi:hypothetical protein L6452_39955 [Arctium lappa]|uniref:Uncharacterized protein n=1 Tax=Arctium lappa TaxID=4217 RepID=A0ACB8XTP8_ARCLA|nr:hypothetical protein L6452_39955 [Arctium lappa]